MDQTEEEATLQKMTNFRFDKPREVTIYFDENEEAAVPDIVTNSAELPNYKIPNNSETQVLNRSENVPHMMKPSNYSVSTQKEAQHVDMGPKIVSKYFAASNQIDEPHRTSLQASLDQRYSKPNIFHLSCDNTRRQMNNFNGLTLSKNGPLNCVTPGTSNAHLEAVENSAAEIEGLDTVSHNLVNIIWWKYHLQQRGMTENSEKEYQCILKKYFALSYPIVNDKILPREHDTTFIRSFLIKTLYLVYAKLHIGNTYLNLDGLFKDMIVWAKEYNKHVINKCIDARYNTIQKSTATVNNNSQRFLKDSNCSKENLENYRPQEKNVTCLFSLDAPGGEVTINVDTNLLPNHHVESQPNNNNKCPIKRHIKLNETGACPTPAKRNQRQRSYNRNGKYTHLSPLTIESVDNIRILNKQRIPSSSDGLIQPFYNQYEILQNNQPILHNDTDALRSSISRDSGFGSPQRDFAANQMNENPVQGRDQCEEMTPLVAHVTSLNQNATYISPGLCRVCGSTTKNVCNGCYKHYYCNTQCQLIDWSEHWQYCSR